MKRSEEVFLVGGGGHAKVVIATLRALGHKPLAVFDDDESSWGKSVLGVPVLGAPAEAPGPAGTLGVLAVGDNRHRQRLAQSLGEFEWMTVVHPAAIVHESALLGAGTVVAAGAVVQPDCRLGTHCIVNTGASVDHDCVLDDFVHVAPGAHLSGGVFVGTGVLIGIGSAAIPGARIGAWATVGAGAAVVDEIPAGATAVGVPARPL